MRIFPSLWPVHRPSRILDRRQLIRRLVERRIGIGERRDDVLGGSAVFFSYAASYFTDVRLVAKSGGRSGEYRAQ